MTATDTSTEYELIETTEAGTSTHLPMAGLMGFMAAFSGAGAAYVALTRDDVGVVAQMSVVTVVCAAMALGAARQRH